MPIKPPTASHRRLTSCSPQSLTIDSQSLTQGTEQDISDVLLQQRAKFVLSSSATLSSWVYHFHVNLSGWYHKQLVPMGLKANGKFVWEGRLEKCKEQTENYQALTVARKLVPNVEHACTSKYVFTASRRSRVSFLHIFFDNFYNRAKILSVCSHGRWRIGSHTQCSLRSSFRTKPDAKIHDGWVHETGVKFLVWHGGKGLLKLHWVWDPVSTT